jgi:4-amino-4-deoxy-L-arabinose transferase-like glycosyltransferase
VAVSATRLRGRVASAGAWSWALALAGLALLVRFPFFFGRHTTPPDSDDGFYITLAHRIVHGHGFGDHHFWTPGYPAFEAALDPLPGRVEDAVTVAQHLMGIGMVAAIVLVAWRYFGRAAAITAGVLAALTPVLVVHEHTLLPDFLFGVLLFGGAVALVEATRTEHRRLWLLVLAGVLFGVATWVKPAGEFLFLAAPPALLFASRSVRRTLVGSAVVALAMLVTISPWVVRNTVKFDVVGMSDQGGRVLYSRVFDVQRLPIPTDSDHGRFAADVERRSRAPFPALREQEVHAGLIRRFGLNDDTAGSVQQSLALTAIRRHPAAYLAESWRLLKASHRRIQDFDRSEELRAELGRTDPPYPPSITKALWRVARTVTGLWWLLSLNTLAGLLLLVTGPSARRTAAACLWSVWLVVSLGTVMSQGGLWRYSVQLAPITWIIGSAGAWLVVSAIVARVRDSRQPTDSRA